ncbi:hypothetical protein E2C01_102374 [Portunus trituberculatus]|uniref:Uncharacterized protein n=1 Tax=Portunus trituberculatus TaxID=210409 RepID=A0A5B7KMF7_PORTR|nr:hypothetical protein [Portunus trituberculatus]
MKLTVDQQAPRRSRGLENAVLPTIVLLAFHRSRQGSDGH